MKKRYILVLLIAIATIFAGCQGKKVAENGGEEVSSTITPTITTIPQNQMGINESLEQELQEIEQLMQELESLDNVQLDL